MESSNEVARPIMRKKLYKSGKLWVAATIAGVTLVGVSAVNAQNVAAAGNTPIAQAQSVSTDGSNAKKDTPQSDNDLPENDQTKSNNPDTGTASDSTTATSEQVKDTDSGQTASPADQPSNGTTQSIDITVDGAAKDGSAQSSDGNGTSENSQAVPETKVAVDPVAENPATNVTVNNQNFGDYFQTNIYQGHNLETIGTPKTPDAVGKDGTTKLGWDSTTNILTLTDDDQWYSGNATLKEKIDLSKDFDLTGYINVGDRTSEDADGMSIGLHDGSTDEVGAAGQGMGLAGLRDVVGWKVDTYWNGAPDTVNNVQRDPSKYQFSAPFAGIIETQDNVVPHLDDADPHQENSHAQLIMDPGDVNVSKPDGDFHKVHMAYVGSTHRLKITYTDDSGDHSFSKDLTAYAQQVGEAAFSINASTGYYTNKQQFTFGDYGSFKYYSVPTVNVQIVNRFDKDDKIPSGRATYNDARTEYTVNPNSDDNLPKGAPDGSYSYYPLGLADASGLQLQGSLTKGGNNGTVVLWVEKVAVPDGISHKSEVKTAIPDDAPSAGIVTVNIIDKDPSLSPRDSCIKTVTFNGGIGEDTTNVKLPKIPGGYVEISRDTEPSKYTADRQIMNIYVGKPVVPDGILVKNDHTLPPYDDGGINVLPPVDGGNIPGDGNGETDDEPILLTGGDTNQPELPDTGDFDQPKQTNTGDSKQPGLPNTGNFGKSAAGKTTAVASAGRTNGSHRLTRRESAKSLPQTGNQQNTLLSVVGMAFAGMLSMMGLTKRREN